MLKYVKHPPLRPPPSTQPSHRPPHITSRHLSLPEPCDQLTAHDSRVTTPARPLLSQCRPRKETHKEPLCVNQNHTSRPASPSPLHNAAHASLAQYHNMSQRRCSAGINRTWPGAAVAYQDGTACALKSGRESGGGGSGHTESDSLDPWARLEYCCCCC